MTQTVSRWCCISVLNNTENAIQLAESLAWYDANFVYMHVMFHKTDTKMDVAWYIAIYKHAL